MMFSWKRSKKCMEKNELMSWNTVFYSQFIQFNIDSGSCFTNYPHFLHVIYFLLPFSFFLFEQVFVQNTDEFTAQCSSHASFFSLRSFSWSCHPSNPTILSHLLQRIRPTMSKFFTKTVGSDVSGEQSLKSHRMQTIRNPQSTLSQHPHHRQQHLRRITRVNLLIRMTSVHVKNIFCVVFSTSNFYLPTV